MKNIRMCFVLWAMLALLTGGVYPLIVTAIAQGFFPYQANGSMVRNANQQVIGSALVAQSFTDPRFFWPRPSACGYNAAASGASNQVYSNPALQQSIRERANALQTTVTGGGEVNVPIDLVTASGSGLDPDISPAGAFYQAVRVAHARGVSVNAVRALVNHHVRGRALGVLGEPTVNVLALNIDLLRLFPQYTASKMKTSIAR